MSHRLRHRKQAATGARRHTAATWPKRHPDHHLRRPGRKPVRPRRQVTPVRLRFCYGTVRGWPADSERSMGVPAAGSMTPAYPRVFTVFSRLGAVISLNRSTDERIEPPELEILCPWAHPRPQMTNNCTAAEQPTRPPRRTRRWLRCAPSERFGRISPRPSPGPLWPTVRVLTTCRDRDSGRGVFASSRAGPLNIDARVFR